MKRIVYAYFSVSMWALDRIGPALYCVVLGTAVSLVAFGLLSLVDPCTWQAWLGRSAGVGIGSGIGYALSRPICRWMDRRFDAWEEGR